MTDVQHDHVQRDLAALQAAEKKHLAAAQRVEEAKALAEDASRTFELAKTKFHQTVEASKKRVGYTVGEIHNFFINNGRV